MKTKCVSNKKKKSAFPWFCLGNTLFVLLLFVFQSCSQPSTGCRDIRATNYDVTADEDCDDACCVYPLLRIQFDHKIQQTIDGVDTLVGFKYNTLYTLDNAPLDSFYFQKIKCYLSDFRLVDADGKEQQVTDEVTLSYFDNAADPITVTDDFLLLDANFSSVLTIGTFEFPGTYETLKFKVGLADELLLTDPDANSNAALQIQTDSLNYEENVGYLSQKYVYFNEPSALDSILYYREEAVEISISTAPFTIISGYDTKLRMTIRYDKWLENINMKTVSAEDFETNSVFNLPNAFSLDSLEYD